MFNKKNNLAVLILAAGKGTRMKSRVTKVLHELRGAPLLSYPIGLAVSLGAKEIIVVAGKNKKAIINFVSSRYEQKNIKVIEQRKLLGTADAVSSSMVRLGRGISDLLVLYGDQPLLSLKTALSLLAAHYRNRSVCTLLTAKIEDAAGYGRIIRNPEGNIIKICEDADLSFQDAGINEVNAGSCIFKKDELAKALKLIRPDNKKKEYYLTEAIGLLAEAGKNISSVYPKEQYEVLGINSRYDLMNLENILNKEAIKRLLDKGVTILSPETTFIDYNVKIGRDTLIKPFVYIGGNVSIGKNCVVGPFCHIRGGSKINDNSVVGSFAEVNRSFIGKNCRIKHFSYLGDARLGRDVNIGAGTVTANFDGKNKNITKIGDKAFIGSDSILIAPVKVGKSSVTGAGSVITKGKDIPDKAIALGVPAKIYAK